MNLLDSSRFDVITDLVGDTPFTVTPYFFLQRQACDVYAGEGMPPRCIIIVPHTPLPDVYVLGAGSLASAELESLADFLGRLDIDGGFLVPADLVPLIRARRPIHLEVEGLCFTYRRVPHDFAVWRPELVRPLTIADADLAGALPDAAAFLYQNFGTHTALLREGLASGVIQDRRLVSMAASLALTPKHCDVGVYTLPRYRNRGYATDCVEVLFARAFDLGVCPLWRIGVRQKVAIYFAEKLGMDEIGTDGREVYLQT